MPQVRNHAKANLWFSGVCDELYEKIATWHRSYWFGDIHSTRKYMDPVRGVVDMPTKMAHRIPFRKIELNHLVRIVEALRPDSQIAEELRGVRDLWSNGRAIRGNKFSEGYWAPVTLPPGIHRVITMCFYPEHVREILTILDEAKGISMPARPSGKDLFEQ